MIGQPGGESLLIGTISSLSRVMANNELASIAVNDRSQVDGQVGTAPLARCS